MFYRQYLCFIFLFSSCRLLYWRRLCACRWIFCGVGVKREEDCMGCDVNAITRIHDSLTFLGATWVGHEMAVYLELDQCSNSRTHQDFAPNQSSYGSPYIVKWNQTTMMKNKKGKPNRNVRISYWNEPNKRNKAGNTISNGTNERKH